MLERELGIVRWVFFLMLVCLLCLGIGFAINPSFVVKTLQDAIPYAPQPHEGVELTGLFYAFTLSYFCILVTLVTRIWKNPEIHFRDLNTLIIHFILPILFSARAIIMGDFAFVHWIIPIVFGALLLIIIYFRRRLHSVMAQRHVFRPIK